MTDETARRALARLARENGDSSHDAGSVATSEETDPPFRETIERATVAIEDVERAASFVDDVGLDELESAVERADRSVSSCADDGRRVLRDFREFRAVAAGEQFRPGHGISLGGDDIGPSK